MYVSIQTHDFWGETSENVRGLHQSGEKVLQSHVFGGRRLACRHGTSRPCGRSAPAQVFAPATGAAGVCYSKRLFVLL